MLQSVVLECKADRNIFGPKSQKEYLKEPEKAHLNLKNLTWAYFCCVQLTVYTWNSGIIDAHFVGTDGTLAGNTGTTFACSNSWYTHVCLHCRLERILTQVADFVCV